MIPGRILGTGAYMPREIITNEELERNIAGVDAAWTRANLGFRERRLASQDETLGEMASRAARAALNEAGIKRVDLVMVATSTSTIPPISSYIQGKLDCGRGPAMDLNMVCSGFISGLVLAYGLLNLYEHILIVGVDAFSRFTDWDDRNCVFFGDGAGALVLGRADNQGLLSYYLDGTPDTQGAFSVNGKGVWEMDSRGVFEAAIWNLPQAILRALSQANVWPADIAHIIPHQASLNLLRNVADKAGLDFEKFRLTLDRYANTAAASIPVTLDDYKDAIQSGQNVLLFGIGAGWNYGAAVLRW